MATELYPGIAFSPQAKLTNNIGAADTIIEVSDASAFPPAPNLATIGTDEEGETVLYTAKTETTLSGCRRGVEGTARAWTAGEVIGRNFTAKDHADLIAAVSETREAAETAANAAEGAQTASQAAQTAAEAAEAQATQAAGTAKTAAENAAQAQEDAQTAVSAAEEAQEAAEAAGSAAVSAAASAGAAQEAAAAAQGTAGTALEEVRTAVETLRPVSRQITLIATGWQGNEPYTQDAAVEGVQADEAGQLVQVVPAEGSKEAWEAAGVKCTEQKAGALTFAAGEKPGENIPVFVILQEVQT